MSATIIRTGVGSERDSQLQNGARFTRRSFLMGSQEQREWPLGLSESMSHHDFQQGDLMSEAGGKIVPLNPALPFAGILHGVRLDPRGRYVGIVIRRGIVLLHVEGVSQPITRETLIYAIPNPNRHCRFTVDASVGVLVGESVNFEVAGSGNVRVHVGLRTSGDSRPYHSGSLIDPFTTRM